MAPPNPRDLALMLDVLEALVRGGAPDHVVVFVARAYAREPAGPVPPAPDAPARVSPSGASVFAGAGQVKIKVRLARGGTSTVAVSQPLAEVAIARWGARAFRDRVRAWVLAAPAEVESRAAYVRELLARELGVAPPG